MGKIIFSDGSKEYGYMSLDTSNSVATLTLYGDICGSMWEKWTNDDTCPQDVSDMLAGIDNTKPLDVHINSGGGSVHGGLAIYSLLKRYAGTKTAYIDGLAASISSVIPLACDKVVIMPAAQFMMHKPWGFIRGNANDIQKEIEVLNLCQESITDIYMTKVKESVTREQITEMINSETWLKGDETSNYFDFEVENIGEAVAYASTMFDKFENVPKEFKQKIETENSKNKENQKRKRKLQLEIEFLSRS